MSIYLISGKLGTYKTTISTVFAKAIIDTMPWMSIKGNFKLDLPGFELIQGFDDLLNAYNSVIVFDESHQFANSRRANSKENVALTLLGTNTRKQNQELFIISPSIASLDRNIRRIADYMIHMQLKGEYIIQTTYEPNEFVEDEYDFLGQNIYHQDDLKDFYSLFDTRDKPLDFTKNANLKQ